MTPPIVYVEPTGGLSLRVRFADGFERVVDLGPWLCELNHPQYAPYLTPAGFAGVRVEQGDVMWGDFDLIFSAEQMRSAPFTAESARAMMDNARRHYEGRRVARRAPVQPR